MVEDKVRQAWHGTRTLSQEVGRVGGRGMGQLTNASQIQRREDMWKRKRYRGWRTRKGKMMTQWARKSKTRQHQRMMRRDMMGSTHRKLCGRRQRKKTQEQGGRRAGESASGRRSRTLRARKDGRSKSASQRPCKEAWRGAGGCRRFVDRWGCHSMLPRAKTEKRLS